VRKKEGKKRVRKILDIEEKKRRRGYEVRTYL